MISQTRRLAGKRAKHSGANFENLFKQICIIQGVECVTIPDSCKQIGARRLIRVVSPFDIILCYNNRAAFLDLKITSSKNFTCSMITPHQVENLRRLSPGGRSGYVIAFDVGVYFFDVSHLIACKPGTHLDIKDGVLLGNRIAFDTRRIFE